MRLLFAAGIATAALALPAAALAVPQVTGTAQGVTPSPVPFGDEATIEATFENTGDQLVVDPIVAVRYTTAHLDIAAGDVVVVGDLVAATCADATAPAGLSQIECQFTGTLQVGESVTISAVAVNDASFDGVTQVEMSLFDGGVSSNVVSQGVTYDAAPSETLIRGGYVNGPLRDADDEINGVVHDELATIPFRLNILNDVDADGEARGLAFTASFPDYYVATVAPGDVTVAAGSDISIDECVVDNDDARELACTFDDDLAPGDDVTLVVSVETLDNSFENNDLQSYFSIDTSNDNGATATNIEEMTGIRDLENPDCEDFFYEAEFTRAQLQTNGTLTVPVDCVDEDGGPLTVTSSASSYGTVTGNGTGLTFTANAQTLAAPNGFYEEFELTFTDDEGETTTATLYLSVNTQSDLASTLTGPTTFAVPAGGGTVTYTNVVRHNGPDATGRTGFAWQISDKATLVSATVNGAAVTCEPANFGGPGFLAYGCGDVALPAVGSTLTGTLTVRYAAGERGLTLPSTVEVTSSAFPGAGAADPNGGNNFVELRTALTAAVTLPPTACATGQTGTPPNCIPAGTSGNDNVTGTNAAERFDGGRGNDTFRGGEGDDTATGGTGNDELFGGFGADVLAGDGGADQLLGETGADTIRGGAGNDRADGGKGDDRVFGDAGNDRLLGGPGNDLLGGGPGDDALLGQGGNDRLSCSTGTDVANGGAGTDRINCIDGTGGDTVNGGLGRDYCIGDRGDRFISCERTIIRR